MPEHLPLILQQHDRLTDIIEAHDADAFAAALRAHLDGTHRR